MAQPDVLRLVTCSFSAAAPELIAEVPAVLGIQQALGEVLQDFVLHRACSPSEAGAVKRGTPAASLLLLQRTLDRGQRDVRRAQGPNEAGNWWRGRVCVSTKNVTRVAICEKGLFGRRIIIGWERSRLRVLE